METINNNLSIWNHFCRSQANLVNEHVRGNLFDPFIDWGSQLFFKYKRNIFSHLKNSWFNRSNEYIEGNEVVVFVCCMAILVATEYWFWILRFNFFLKKSFLYPSHRRYYQLKVARIHTPDHLLHISSLTGAQGQGSGRWYLF